MSKLDREFLVPYLQNVCAAELHISKLQQSISDAKSRIQWFKEEHSCSHPTKKYYAPPTADISSTVLGIALAFLVL